ncbi:sensor histidine kinase [Marinicrinis sediminis]|uniref:histidine kinase n=1 Tax=Marinicrinis sediminis TaxID=1652465 RepID=A0ABW5R9D6_9BACL
MSIRLKLTLWYTGILTVIVVVFGFILYYFLQNYLYDNVRNNLKEKGMEVYEQRQLLGRSIIFPLDAFESYFFQIVNAEGQIMRQSENLQGLALPVKEGELARYQQGDISGSLFKQYALHSDVTFMVYDMPFYQGTTFIGLLQVAVVVSDVEQTLEAFRWIYLFAALVLLALAASVGWFMARKALTPIDHVIEAAEQIEKGDDLSHRIAYEGSQHDEIGRLVDRINRMLGRIQQAYDDLNEAYRAQRRFVSDASHELRTPLTTIRGNLELLQKMQQKWIEKPQELDPVYVKETNEEAMKDILSETERMSRLVNDLLSLARADAGHDIVLEEIDLLPLVQEVARRAEWLPRKATWQIGDLSPLEGVVIQGNADYLQQLFFIFIENAFKYTPQGEVMLDAVTGSSQVGIRIRDTGVGMEAEEVPHIFERFYRADVSRGETPGTGLGLSIAKWIMDAHHGSVEVETQKGTGTTFIIWLPLGFAE